LREAASLTRLALGLAVAVSMSSAACAARDTAPPLAAAMRVVDSAEAPGWNAMEDASTIYRVETRGTRGVRLVDSVLAPLPIVVGDSALVGLRLSVSGVGDESEGERRLFRLHLASGRLEMWPAPTDAWYVAFDIVPSPDGRYIAYVADDTGGGRGTHAAVRELATGALVVQGPGGGGCDCDVDMNHARWFAPDSFEIAVAHVADDRGGWQPVARRASARRFRTDTLSKEPSWH
jgi:hypothetical protein